jgi:hypothetical protein
MYYVKFLILPLGKNLSSQFLLLCDHQGATHLLRERQSLDPTGFAEMPKAPPTPQSSAQALDAVGLDWSLSHMRFRRRWSCFSCKIRK